MGRLIGSVVVMLLWAASGLYSQTVTNRQQIFFFKQVCKNKTKLGILCDMNARQADVSEIEQAATSYQVWPKAANVKTAGDVGSSLRKLLNDEKVEAILIMGDPVLTTADARKYIIQECTLKKVPVIGDSQAAVEAGALYCLTNKDNKVVPLLNMRAAAALQLTIPPEVVQDSIVVVQP